MPRFQTILVPVDFSSHAHVALDLALDLAKESHGTLHLLHAYELPTTMTMSYGVAIPPSVWEGVKEAAAAQLEKIVKRVEAAGVTVVAHLITGSPADSIAETALENRVDLIVMGTRGLTGLKHVLLGIVAERNIRIAPCPVLTVKEPGKE